MLEELAHAGRPARTATDESAAGEPDPSVRAPEPADPVLRALGHDPATLDALMARCGWPPHELSAHLLELEMSGQIARLPGGLFQRIRAA